MNGHSECLRLLISNAGPPSAVDVHDGNGQWVTQRRCAKLIYSRVLLTYGMCKDFRTDSCPIVTITELLWCSRCWMDIQSVSTSWSAKEPTSEPETSGAGQLFTAGSVVHTLYVNLSSACNMDLTMTECLHVNLTTAWPIGNKPFFSSHTF